MMLVGAILIPWLIGFLILKRLTKHTALLNPFGLALAIGPAVGLAIISLILFVSLLLTNGKGIIVSNLVIGLLFALLVWLELKEVPWIGMPSKSAKYFQEKMQQLIKPFSSKQPSRIVFFLFTIAAFGLLIATLVYYLRYYISYCSWNIFGGWDAQYLWNYKARFLSRDPLYWRNMFSPVMAQWLLPDYPLLLPGSVAWGWNFTAHEMLIWPAVISLLFFLSLCFLVIWYLFAYVSAFSAFVAGSFLLTVHAYQFWSTTQYADIPFALFVTAATLLLICALRHRELKLFFLTGFLTGCAIWTKNEGIFFSLWLFTFFILTFSRASQIPASKKKSAFLLFLLGYLIPFLCFLIIKTTLGGAGIYMCSGRSAADYGHLITNLNRTKLIVISFLVLKWNSAQWLGLWACFYLAFLAVGRRLFQAYRWIIPGMVFCLEAGYFLVYQITPIELPFHISTSLLRLLLHSGVLALIFIFEVFNPKDCFAIKYTK